MACYIYIVRTNTNKEISTLETNIIEMQKTINNLQEEISTLSNTINSNQNGETKFSNDEIKKSLQNYLDLLGAIEGLPMGLLVKLGLYTYNDYANANADDDNYIKTNIKYSTYKGMLQKNGLILNLRMNIIKNKMECYTILMVVLQ